MNGHKFKVQSSSLGSRAQITYTVLCSIPLPDISYHYSMDAAASSWWFDCLPEGEERELYQLRARLFKMEPSMFKAMIRDVVSINAAAVKGGGVVSRARRF